ncbi:hypothetical protein CEXT_59101 [Caerostris extrusa]|uniref:Uncharacterized protein n=1 Tax=Caerostris extrusa TaxID=172846 RepID=A0AAV4U5F9_CAEEX|nr:hypothetical protein CEXT_59101 [Caerostris extrusa]
MTSKSQLFQRQTEGGRIFDRIISLAFREKRGRHDSGFVSGETGLAGLASEITLFNLHLKQLHSGGFLTHSSSSCEDFVKILISRPVFLIGLFLLTLVNLGRYLCVHYIKETVFH